MVLGRAGPPRRLRWPRDLWLFWREVKRRGLAGTADRPARGEAPPPIAEAVASRVRLLLAEPPPPDCVLHVVPRHPAQAEVLPLGVALAGAGVRCEVAKAAVASRARRKRTAMAHHAASRRGAALLACALLLGCGGGGGAGGSGGGVSGSSGLSAASGRDRYAGRYEGQRLPPDVTASDTCRGRAREVRFEVENGIIEMRTNRRAGSRRKAELWGAVSTDGQVAMRPASGKRTVAGRIEGDRLTATDTQDPQAVAQAAAQGRKAPCLYRYEATRVGSRSGARHAGDAAGAGAPPVEGLPQP